MEHFFHTNGLFVRIFVLVPVQSASIVVAFGGKLFLDPLQSVLFCRIWQEFVLDPFQSASIDATSGKKLLFGSF